MYFYRGNFMSCVRTYNPIMCFWIYKAELIKIGPYNTLKLNKHFYEKANN